MWSKQSLPFLTRSFISIVLCLGVSGCCRGLKADLDATKRSLQKAEQSCADREQLSRRISTLEETNSRLVAELAAAKGRCAELERLSEAQKSTLHECRIKVDELTALLEQQKITVAAFEKLKQARNDMLAALDAMGRAYGGAVVVTRATLPNQDELISIHVNEKVLFKAADWQLSPEGAMVVRGAHRQVLGQILKFDPHTRIHVVGHTDSQPIQKKLRRRNNQLIVENYFLGWERAVSVYDELVGAGLAAQSLLVESRSSGEPLCQDMPPSTTCNATNRRVVYEVTLASSLVSLVNLSSVVP